MELGILARVVCGWLARRGGADSKVYKYPSEFHATRAGHDGLFNFGHFCCRILKCAHAYAGKAAAPYSWSTTVSRDLLTLILPLYSMKPNFLNLFMKKFTRERVVPIMWARVSWETFGRMRSG
jgi:hypothetical protein